GSSLSAARMTRGARRRSPTVFGHMEPSSFDRPDRRIYCLEVGMGTMGVKMAAEVQGRDRRRFPRMRTGWLVLLESADGRVGVGQVVDASLSGMRINTDLEVQAGTALTLRITLPKDTGRIEVLVKGARRDAHGFGVSFLTLAEGEAERIAPFVAPGDI